MSEEIRTQDLIDQELEKKIPEHKQALINRGIFQRILGDICDIPHDRLRQPTTVYSHIAPEDVEVVRDTITKVIQEAIEGGVNNFKGLESE